jgi:hypothetical protein
MNIGMVISSSYKKMAIDEGGNGVVEPLKPANERGHLRKVRFYGAPRPIIGAREVSHHVPTEEKDIRWNGNDPR